MYSRTYHKEIWSKWQMWRLQETYTQIPENNLMEK
jgi:hypothetical protein